VNSPGARRSAFTTGGTPRMSARTERSESRVVCHDSIVHRSDNDSEFWSADGKYCDSCGVWNRLSWMAGAWYWKALMSSIQR
jgi:hypothetical protein